MKWKIMLTSIPIALVIVVVKLSLLEFFKFPGLVELSDIALIVSAGVFLIGFMLAGTMADYKESERIPGEIASALESIEETCILLADRPNFPFKTVYESCHHTAQRIHDWFYKKISTEEMYGALTSLKEMFVNLERAGANPPIMSRSLNELSSLRRVLTRTNVISKTGFLATGYALLEVLLVVITGVMLIVKFKHEIAAIVVVFFISLVYIYMYKLIRDIDDPFEHSEDDSAGAAEVALFPLQEYIERLEKRIKIQEQLDNKASSTSSVA
jgi:hypothetical protein